MNLTPKQYNLFKFIQITEPAPTYGEIAEFMGVSANTSAYAMIGRLVNKGLLTRSRKHRSIKVVVE